MLKTHFDAIYQAALELNYDMLAVAIRDSCIDVWRQESNYYSAATQLAKDGQLSKAEWLMNLGANIHYVAYGAALGGHRAYAEELLHRGAAIKMIARGAGQGGHRAYAEELLGRGAHINFVALGAALGGYRVYAEELLSRGAFINSVAYGAAQGGHLVYVEELLSRGALINSVAYGAAQGGHRVYAEELLDRGAHIISVARGAALGGYRTYAEELLGRGANIDDVAHGAELGGHITPTIHSQLRYLSYYHPKWLKNLIHAFSSLRNPILINDEIQQRAIDLSKYIHNRKLSFSQALARTERTAHHRCEGALYLLMLLTTKTPPFQNEYLQNIPFEIWCHIFTLITPEPMSETELKSLGFAMQRAYIGAQLLSYQEASNVTHKNRAYSFFKAVNHAQDETQLIDLVDKQAQLLQGKNPYPLLERHEEYKTDI